MQDYPLIIVESLSVPEVTQVWTFFNFNAGCSLLNSAVPYCGNPRKFF